MANPVQALRALQEIDRDVFRVRGELARLPAERSRRQNELEARRARIGEERERAKSLKVRVREVENQTSTQRDRIRKLEKEASSTRDVAVAEACRYEIRSLRRLIDDAERDALGMVEQHEEADARVAALEAELEGESAAFEEYARNVARELAAAERRLEELVTRRSEHLTGEVTSATLALYDRLLAARSGEAMATLESGICQGCYMEVPRNLVVLLARGTQIIQCPSCDRILYLT